MSDALPVIDGHLAEGEGWVLSRAREPGTGAARLVITVFDADLATLRRDLAVAGSVGGTHLADVVDAVAVADGSVALVVDAPGGPSLAELVSRRGVLSAGEIVTLLAPLAATLSSLHARGLAMGALTPATVWIAADGRPVLVPVGCGEPADDGGDLVALATMGMSTLDRSSPGAAALLTALQAAASGRGDAARLADALLRATAAQPIATTALTSADRPRTRRRRSRQVRPAIATVLVAAIAVVVGGAFGRHGGNGTVLAAPPSSVVRPPPSAQPWSVVMTELERARARAYATGVVALLDDVYAPASRQGAADRRLLSRMTAKGQRAVGLQAFVEAVRVRSATDGRVTLRVTDALTAYDVIGRHGRVVRHGKGRPSRQWDVTLVRTADGWRVDSVRRTQG